MIDKPNGRIKKIATDEKRSEHERLAEALDRQFSEVFGTEDDGRFFVDMLLPKPPPVRASDTEPAWRPTVISGGALKAGREAEMNQRIKVERARTAAFDVDAQNTFTEVCPDELPVEGGQDIVDELNAQAALCAVRVGSKDAHSPEAVWVAGEGRPAMSRLEGYENADVCWPVHAVPGTRGFRLIDGLPPVTDYDYFVWKGVEPDMHPYGACFHDIGERMSTGVIEYLKSRGIDTVLVGGLATDYCVRHTVLQLLRAGFRVVVNLAAVRGVAPDTSEAALREMQQAGAELSSGVAELEAAS